MIQDDNVVEIRTEDLSTGLTVGQTSWSGRNKDTLFKILNPEVYTIAITQPCTLYQPWNQLSTHL